MPLVGNGCFCGSGRLNTSISVPLGSSNATMSSMVGSGSFLPARLHAMRLRLLLEGVEVVVRPELEAEPHAARAPPLRRMTE